MLIEMVKAPSKSFLEMLFNNVRSSEKRDMEEKSWAAVGLLQAKLIELYWAADVAEKASSVKALLVMGNCPQHVQMLAVFGKQAAVRAALDKIAESYSRRDKRRQGATSKRIGK